MDLVQVNRVAGEAAAATLKKADLSRVFSTVATDPDGREALLITVVLRGRTAKKITGDRALDTIVKINGALQKFGEDRFPIIEFATEDELESDAASQS